MKNIKILSLAWITLFCASVLAANGSSDYGVNASQLQGVNVSSAHPVADQFLQFNGITQTWMSKAIAGSSGGTVTSIAQTVPSFLSISGSPITTSGTLAIAYSGVALPIANGGTGSTNGSITGSGALLFAAGGSNQNVTVTPSGSGNTILNGSVGVATATPAYPLDVTGKSLLDNYALIGQGVFTGFSDLQGGLSFVNPTGLPRGFVSGGAGHGVIFGVNGNNFGQDLSKPGVQMQFDARGQYGRMQMYTYEPSSGLERSPFSISEVDSVNLGGASTTNTQTATLFIADNTALANIPSLQINQNGNGTMDIMRWARSDDTVIGVIDATGSVGIGTSSPQAILDAAATGDASAIIVPRDTTANRPTVAVNGMIRYNTDDTAFEGYANGAWAALGGGGGGGANVNLNNLVDPVEINVTDVTFADTGNISSPVQVEISATSGNGSQIYVYDSAVDIEGGLNGNGTINLLSEAVSIQGQGNGPPIFSIDDGGGNLFGLQNSGGANYTVNVPATQGSPGQVLATDGGNPGQLSWSDFANGSLSNLVGPTNINADLILNTGVNPAIVKTKDDSAATSGIILTSGDSSGDVSGYVAIASGGMSVAGTTGSANVSTGSNLTTPGGISGDVSLQSGQAFAQSGAIFINTSPAEISGDIILQTDPGNVTSGNIRLAPATTGGGTIGNVKVESHLVTVGTAPAASSCGTSPSVAGNDVAGRVTVGSGVITSCTITFNKTWVTAPACVVQDESASLALQAVASTSTLTISAVSTFGAGSIVYQCVGY